MGGSRDVLLYDGAVTGVYICPFFTNPCSLLEESLTLALFCAGTQTLRA